MNTRIGLAITTASPLLILSCGVSAQTPQTYSRQEDLRLCSLLES